MDLIRDPRDWKRILVYVLSASSERRREAIQILGMGGGEKTPHLPLPRPTRFLIFIPSTRPFSAIHKGIIHETQRGQSTNRL
jgi:hypothetical protein